MRTHVEREDLQFALGDAVAGAQQSVQAKYVKAVYSPYPDNIYEHVLLACACAPIDEFGLFTATGVRNPLSVIKRKQYTTAHFSRHLDEFSSTKRENILTKIGVPRRFRFKFTEPPMEPYVILHGLSEGLITKSEIDRLFAT